MGIKKSGWIKWTVLLVLAGGLLSAGIFVNHIFFAKAASNEAMNQSNNELNDSKATENLQNVVKGSEAEKEWMQKQQDKAVADNRKNEDKQNATVPDQPPKKDTAEVTPDTKKPTSPPAKPEQPPAQPANSGKKTIYLTFDDGPAVFSKDIISLLEKYHFKATFFMLDPNIKKYPDAVKLMVQMGDSIGSHGVTHNRKLFYASQASVLGEMDQTRNTLKSITGLDSFLIRTPYGSAPYMTPEYKQAVSDHGYLLWDWNIDSKDWYYKDERFVSSVIQQISHRINHPGPIVILLHERRETLAHLPKLFDYLSRQGFECKAIDSSMPPIHF